MSEQSSTSSNAPRFTPVWVADGDLSTYAQTTGNQQRVLLSFSQYGRGESRLDTSVSLDPEKARQLAASLIAAADACVPAQQQAAA